jgi:hypothetical protein
MLPDFSCSCSLLIVAAAAAGSSVESERGPAADFVLHAVYIIGLLVFAAVLGIVCDDIGTQVDKVCHAVVLGS